MKKLIIKIVLILIVSIALFFGYSYYKVNIKPTKIAFVHIPDYMYADYNKADDGYFIKTKSISEKNNDLSELLDYDVVYIFGMGFKPTEVQNENLKKLIKKGTPLYVFLATNPESDISTLSKKELKDVEAYFKNSKPINSKRLLNYSRRVLDGKKMFSDEVEYAYQFPKNYFFNPASSEIYEDKASFDAFYKKQGLYKENAKKVLLVTSNLAPSNPYTRQPYFKLIEALEAKGINMYASTGFSNRLKFIEDVNPDMVLFIPHGRLAPGKAKELKKLLVEKNIPVLGPQVIFQDHETWINDQKGMSGGMLSQNIIAPELDGVTLPYSIGAKFPNEEGIMVFKELPKRIKTFASTVDNFLNLQNKDNKNKKVAVFYFKGPGKNAMVAEGMEVVPSLLNMLKKLKSEGYTTGELPKTSKELYARIQKEGKLLGPYAKGTFETFIKEGNPALIHQDTLQKWMQETLEPRSIENVKKLYGELPGEHMITIKDSIQHLAVARVQFGNIVLMPQPLPAYGEDEFKLVHGVEQAPPYPYVGAYLWARKSFKADALMHFGTHGSLEFTPYKQTGLSNFDWSDILIGDKPHFYVYTVGNVGEAMIAKRRSYATIISHLTPPFDQSDFNPEMQGLHDTYHSFLKNENNPALQNEYLEKFKVLALKANLDKQLNLDITLEKPFTEEQLDKIAAYIHSVEAQIITLGLYNLGEEFTEKHIQSTLVAMNVDRIAYSKADLDVLKGAITEKQKNDPVYFDDNYRSPTLWLLKRVMKNIKTTDFNQFIDKSDLAKLETWNKKHPKRDFGKAMSAMISMFEKVDTVQTNSTAHLENKNDRIEELVIKLASNETNKNALLRLKDQAQFKKSSSLLDRAALKKVKQIAKMIPAMQKTIDVMTKPDFMELIELMQLEKNYDFVFKLLDNPNIKNKLKELEINNNNEIITKLTNKENTTVIFNVMKNNSFTKSENLSQLTSYDNVLNLYITNANLYSKFPKGSNDIEILQKILSGEKAIQKLKNTRVNVQNRMDFLKAKEKEFAMAVKEYSDALLAIPKNYELLKTSPTRELDAIVNVLNGGFIPASSGGDIVRNPVSLPTGRNLYSINAEKTPNEASWNLGVKMAKILLDNYKKKHNEYPKKVSFTLWGGEFIRGEGTNVAQILYLLGVEPIRSGSGSVKGVKLIPSEELGRPRIDVVVQTSGQFRDFAASRIFLIDKAVKLAAAAKENEKFNNNVADGVLAMEDALKIKGFTPEEAKKLSTSRVFGGVNGNYGAGIMGLVESGDKWEDDKEIADQYIKNMGAIYTEDNWGEFKPGLFEASLQNTDMVVMPKSSNTWGALSLDHVYEFMGGVTNAIRNTTGKDPDGYFVDMRNKQNAFVQTVDEAIWTEAQSTLFNPKYITELMNGEASSAEVFAETTRDLYGWNVMKPDAIDNEMWDKMHKVYVQDEFNIGVKEFFEKENPYALQEVTAVMLETARKGYWKADAKVIKEVAELHAKLVKNHDAGCSGFVCDNAKLKEFISQNISDEVKQEYQDKIKEVRETSGTKQSEEKSRVLKKVTEEKTIKELITDNKTVSYMVLGLFLFLITAFVYGRVRRK